MNIKIKEKNNMKNFLTGMKMKNILNKISLKGLFVVLFLIVSLFSYKWANASDCCPDNPPPWLDPAIQVGGRGDSSAFSAPSNVSCSISCSNIERDPIESIYLGGGVSICSCSEDCFDPTKSFCKDYDNSSSETSDRSVSLNIYKPLLGITEEYLPVKPNQPVSVNLIIGWKIKGDFDRCEAVRGKDDNGGKWSGSKNPKGATESLGNVLLYADNLFELDCYYREEGATAESKVSGYASVSGKEDSIIVSSTLGGTILDIGLERTGVSEGTRVPIVTIYNAINPSLLGPLIDSAEKALWLTPAGAEALILETLTKYAFVRTGINAVKTLPRLVYNFCGLRNCAPVINYYKLKILGGKVIDLSKLTGEEFSLFKEYLAKETLKPGGVEFAVLNGKVIEGTAFNHVALDNTIKALGDFWHSHPNSTLTPGSCEVILTDIQKIKQIFRNKGIITPQDHAYQIEGVVLNAIKAARKNGTIEELGIKGGDNAYMRANELRTFQIGTISKDGKYFEKTWNTLTDEQIAKVIAEPVPVKIEIDGELFHYSQTAMDFSWGGDGWIEFYKTNLVK
jgi:hypothetical protein